MCMHRQISIFEHLCSSVLYIMYNMCILNALLYLHIIFQFNIKEKFTGEKKNNLDWRVINRVRGYIYLDIHVFLILENL